MEGRQERAEPLDRAHDLSSLSGEVEAVARGDRSMQQCLGCSVRSGHVVVARRVGNGPPRPAKQVAEVLLVTLAGKRRRSPGGVVVAGGRVQPQGERAAAVQLIHPSFAEAS